MRLGVNLPQTDRYDLARDVTVFARAAEEIGYDSLWAYERILAPVDTSGPHGLYGVPDLPWPPSYSHTTDALVTLSLAAAVTSRVELGTSVLVPGLHLPFRLARSIAALDTASGGRVIAGLGSGWSIDEFAATAPRPIEERGAALDEFLDIAAAVWGPDPVSYATDRYRLAPSRVNPKPARRVPIYLAGGNRTALSRIARRGDGWLPTGVPPQQVGRILGELRAEAAAGGRDPESLTCIFQLGVRGLAEAPDEGRQPYTGSLRQIVTDIAALEEAGVDHVLVTLASVAGDLKELIALAETLHREARAAGL
ncbi:luciferase [Actinoplanes sp. SE50]|uniref:TIGR03619 family F420-dependent LLM class oxidoreductase n=1 Tax=unclassified Actinoplanes TaxID=2626549 RepID=UPI00023EC5E5|nr:MULTISPECIES: TIGR03619 family F420-dependent LLM class oxidoreductase [unclassified Actinoplanes]AEV83647.1 Alkanesulfonate monooxygenase [Actinoplanes sp. SE50/110]ATO82209.1 luciferase [Actinoplanes sp. SE50]SLL99616.1 LLM class F420-dependent oxidoreductase [Actinoplanes sp. SE50/110]